MNVEDSKQLSLLLNVHEAARKLFREPGSFSAQDVSRLSHATEAYTVYSQSGDRDDTPLDLQSAAALAQSVTNLDITNSSTPSRTPAATLDYLTRFAGYLLGDPVGYAVCVNGRVQIVPQQAPRATPVYVLNGFTEPQESSSQRDTRTAAEIIDDTINRVSSL